MENVIDNNLIYLNYKEPLTKVDKGFGYLGTVATTKSGEQLQCHICGKLFIHLAAHVYHTHGMNGEQYKDKFKLAKKTLLVSDSLRDKEVACAIKRSSIIQEEAKRNLAKGRSSVKNKRPAKSLEQKNKEGRCPEQLIAKIQEVARELGRTPSAHEFRRHYNGYLQSIQLTFGSWNKALKIAKLTSNKPGHKPQFSKEALNMMLIDFQKRYGRRPSTSDLRAGLLPSQPTFSKYFGCWSNAVAELEKAHV